MKTQAKRVLIRLAILLATLGLTGVVLAQVSPNFDLGWHLLSGGGGSRSSTNYQLNDATGQWVGGNSTSTDYKIDTGFWYGVGSPGTTTTDAYEEDDLCSSSNPIPTDGTIQTHTFHDEGDEDWVSFNGQAGKTYVIRVDNVGDNVDAVVMLYDQCDDALPYSDDDSFGPTVLMEWDCTSSGEYFLKLLQNDPSISGEGTNYDLSIAVDLEPPSAPRSVRVSGANEALIVQWDPSPERDVAGYEVRWRRDDYSQSGVEAVDGPDNTYGVVPSLNNGQLYYVAVVARDFSDNPSDPSVEVGPVMPSPSGDATMPGIVIDRPSANPVYTTTVGSLTIGGDCSDSGGNLSRVHVRNTTNGAEGWDYGLSGGSAVFNVESIPLAIGDNVVTATVHDDADNKQAATITIHRLSGLNGAVVIVGGHNDSSSLQNNINYVTNRAYRVFRNAGFGAEDIMYLSPSPQDADNDGVSDVISPTTPANVHSAIQWAATRVGPGVPLYLFLMDHGIVEAFCADGCSVSSGGRITSKDLGQWLDELETTSGCDSVNVLIEACHSGSFIDQLDRDDNLSFAHSIAKNGRVVIASTGRTSNAYASVQGAYFSDVFFSAVAESSSLLNAFNQAKAAVEATGNNQTPWLDDNGDHLHNPADGGYATNRYVASFFGALMPEILNASVSLAGSLGTIEAWVERGDESMDVVWAAIYAPSFQEPTTTTLTLGVPQVKLEPDPERSGWYTADYNGFGEDGIYRVLIYAQDEVGNQPQPWVVIVKGKEIYVPLVLRN